MEPIQPVNRTIRLVTTTPDLNPENNSAGGRYFGKTPAMISRSILLLFFFSAITAYSQDAYWVIESNVNVQHLTIVRVYNLGNQLIGEKLLNSKVDIARKRDRRMLDRIVKAVVRNQPGLVARRAPRVLATNPDCIGASSRRH